MKNLILIIELMDKFVLFLGLVFTIWEILKLFMLETYWKFSINPKKYPVLRIFESLYVLYCIVLFFTAFRLIGVILLMLSFTTLIPISADHLQKTPINTKIRSYLIADSLCSIIVLSPLIYKLIS